MRPFRFLIRHPVALLGAFVLAFVVWVGRDAFRVGFEEDVVLFTDKYALTPPPNGRFPLQEIEKQKLTPQLTARVLPKLKVGMTRTEVEGLVGAPAPDDIHPATVAGGKVTYYTAYEADLAPPSTIRSIRPIAPLGRTIGAASKDKDPSRSARTLVTLEFDASKPGHPLVEVYYPDPLF